MNFIQSIQQKAKQLQRKIVLPEGDDPRMVKAAELIQKQDIAQVVLLGEKEKLTHLAQQAQADLSQIEIINIPQSPHFENFVKIYMKLREKKGMDLSTAIETMKNPLFFGAMMVREKMADASLAGAANTTGSVLRAALQIIGVATGFTTVSSCFEMVLPTGKILSFADCAVVPDPTAEQLAEIAITTSHTHYKLTGEEPRVAMLSFSTKGSAKHELVDKVVEATDIARKKASDLKIDGELQLDAAIVPAVAQKKAGKSPVAGNSNVLIFPDLQAGNIGYKLVQRLGNAQAIGPIIQGLAKPANDLSRGCNVDDIVNMAAICALMG